MGYIKLDRKFKDWKWKNKPNMVAVWIHLLLEANYVENTFENIVIPAGSLVTSIKSIAEKTGLTIQQTRTCISNLQITNEITIKSTNKYSIITINKWEEYQSNGKNQQTNQQSEQIKTNNQITNKLTTLEEYKEIKKEEYINNNNYYVPDRTRKKDFVIPSISDIEGYCIENGYSTVSAKKFYEYYQKNDWTVKSKGKRKKMSNWKLALNNWVLNEIRYNDTNELKNKTRQAYIEDVEMRKKKQEFKEKGGDWFE